MNPQPKPERVDDPKYLAWIRKQPCAFCGLPGTEDNPIIAAHENVLKTSGTSTKADDNLTAPLHFKCHHSEHGGNKTFWKKKNVSMMILFLICKYSKETGHSIDGYDPLIFVLKTITENWKR